MMVALYWREAVTLIVDVLYDIVVVIVIHSLVVQEYVNLTSILKQVVFLDLQSELYLDLHYVIVVRVIRT